MTEKIQISLLKTAGDTHVGCIRLNKPKALNAVDLDMVTAMQSQLDLWRDDDSIGAVFIDSEGEKAFCAGGDIVSMYKAMVNEQAINPSRLPDFMAQFFEQEYRLNYAIHAFPKPIVCWGRGIIMGGGLGVFAGASHKIVTQTSRVAMPEITIGLFPDVGASYFLNKMPKGVGKFLGLTASNINAVDCINIGLADYFLLNDSKSTFLSELAGLTLLSGQNISATVAKVQKIHNAGAVWSSLLGNLSPIMKELESLAPLSKRSDIDVFLEGLCEKHPQSSSLNKALLSFRNGSPLTLRLVIEQLARGEGLSLAECLQMELSMAYQCSIVGEFQEGVRALLIDKDNQPKWLYKDDANIPDDLIASHFSHFTRQVTDHADTPAIKNPLLMLATEYGELHA